MKRIIIILALNISYNTGYSQIIDVDYTDENQTFIKNEEGNKKPVEVLGRNFVDIFGNGKIQGTAQLLKLRIGEPKGFYVPFYFFLGASGDGLGNSK